MRGKTRRLSPISSSDIRGLPRPEDPFRDSSVWDMCLEGKQGCLESSTHLALPMTNIWAQHKGYHSEQVPNNTCWVEEKSLAKLHRKRDTTCETVTETPSLLSRPTDPCPSYTPLPAWLTFIPPGLCLCISLHQECPSQVLFLSLSPSPWCAPGPRWAAMRESVRGLAIHLPLMHLFCTGK